jgi:hypothetical protein
VSEVELTIKGEVEVLRLQPGDKVIITLDNHISGALLDVLREQAECHFPDNKVIIVSPGIRIGKQTAAWDGAGAA